MNDTDWVAALNETKTGVFEIPPGRHMISGLRITNATDLTIDGNGATLVVDPYGENDGLRITKSSNVKISGLRFAAPGAFGQWEVLDSDERGLIVTTEDKDAPPPQVEGTVKVIAYDPQRRFRPFMRAYVGNVAEMRKGTYRVEYRTRHNSEKNGKPPIKGDTVYLGKRQGRQAVALRECKDMTLRDVLVHGAGQMAFIELRCHNSVYENCHVVPEQPWESFSANADGFHARGPTQGPSLIRCSVRGSGDDPLNIHGELFYVAEPDTILYRPPTNPIDGPVYVGTANTAQGKVIDASYGDKVEDPAMRDAYAKKAGLIQQFWHELVLRKVRFSERVPAGYYGWSHIVEGVRITDFYAVDCWTFGLKLNCELPVLHNIATIRAGGKELITAAEKQWLEGPSGKVKVNPTVRLGIP